MKNSSLFFLAFGFYLLLSACGDESEKASMPEAIDLPVPEGQILITQDQFDATDMQLGELTTTVFPQAIEVSGYIDVPPKSKAAVSVYYGGYIKNLDLLPGQRVRRGQLLFLLENPDFVQMQQDYLETKAQLAYLQSDFERQKTLAAENIASQKNYLKAESDYRVQQARMEGLRKKMQMLGIDLDRVEEHDLVAQIEVRAPISGYITHVYSSSGSFLNASTTALELISKDHLHLELDVFEKDIVQLKEDQLIRFRVPGSNGQDHLAKVHLIGSMVEGENRVVRVHGHLEDDSADKRLIPGMYIEAAIETQIDSVRALPEEAVVRMEAEAFILVQNDRSSDTYIFERQQVNPGRIVNGMIEIKDAPLSLAERPILIKGAFNLITE